MKEDYISTLEDCRRPHGWSLGFQYVVTVTGPTILESQGTPYGSKSDQGCKLFAEKKLVVSQEGEDFTELLQRRSLQHI